MARKKRSLFRKPIISVIVLLAALTAFQYYDQQVVTWHRDALALLEDVVDKIDFLQPSDRQAPFVVERSQPTDASRSASSEPAVEIERRYLEPGEPRFELVGRVSRVIDGDSLEVRVNGQEWEIRLHGVDSPEYDQPHGRDATRALTRKIERRTVLINIVELDSYERLVGTVFHEGQNINLAMVAEGHGWWYRQYAANDDSLEEAEQMARDAGLGLWSGAEPIAPWTWRRNGRN